MAILNYKTMAWLGVSALLALLTIYVFEIGHLTNTVGAGEMIWKSLLIALLVGVVIGKKLEHHGEELVDSIRIWAISIFIPIFFTPLIASLTNRLVSIYPKTEKSFEFIEEVPYASSAYGFLKDETVEPTGCYLFVYYENKIRRLKQEKCRYWDKDRGDKIMLVVKKGLWGYEVISTN